MMTIDKFNFAGKRQIVRVDFNVPLNEEGKNYRRYSYPWCTAYFEKNLGRRWCFDYHVTHG